MSITMKSTLGTPSYFMELLLRSNYPQFHLYTPREFSEFLRNRGLNVSEERLEYYDEKGILRPILRLNRPVVNRSDQKYASMFFGGARTYSELYVDGLIEFPKEGDFQPWKNYWDGYDERIWQYYHPFQAVTLHRLTSGLGVRLHPKFFDDDIDDGKLSRWFENTKKDVADSLKITINASQNYVSRIGLLMLLEEPYAPHVKGFFNPSFREDDALKKWLAWRKNEFNPKTILEISKLSTDEVKKWYEWLATEGLHSDPLRDWSPLLLLIRRGKKRRLRDTPLLVQDYYELASMVKLFIKDLTGETMFDPDEWGDGNKDWKSRIYGEPFDSSSGKTQKSILDDFMTPRPMKLAIVYEGESEDTVIKMILKSYVADPKDGGISLYCAQGSANMSSKNLDGLVSLAEQSDMEIYVIVDKDSESVLKKFVADGRIKAGMYTVWQNDFEFDNFGLEKTMQKINEILQEKSIPIIDPNAVQKRIMEKQLTMMRSIKDILYTNTNKKLDDVVSKRKLAEDLFHELTNNREEKKSSTPSIPIEVVMSKILNSIPRYYDSTRD